MRGLAETIARCLETGLLKAFRAESLDTAIGYSTDELESHGIQKRHLKWLERQGIVLRARLETKKGHLTRWVFVVPSAESAEKTKSE